ncbi:MAG: hypothetical protein RL345_1115 [Chloroflexota bacterium]|jgi:type 1 glutamine amidotransferase
MTMLKALIVRGGWAGHEPIETSERVAASLREAGVHVEISDTLDSLSDLGHLRTMDLVVPLRTMDRTATKDQVKPLIAAVRAGVGIGGWHGGMCDAFRDDTEYQFMTGGQWVAHPGNAPAIYRVRMGPVPHISTEGMADFTIQSEQYYMHVDPGVTVHATTHVAIGAASGDVFDQSVQDAVDRDEMAGVVMPVTWTKRWGLGRVWYTSLGHVASVFDTAEALTMVTRGLIWAAQGASAHRA